MAERQTLQQLMVHRARQRTSVNVEVVGEEREAARSHAPQCNSCRRRRLRPMACFSVSQLTPRACLLLPPLRAGVVHCMEKLEGAFKGRAGANPSAPGKTRRAFWRVSQALTRRASACGGCSRRQALAWSMGQGSLQAANWHHACLPASSHYPPLTSSRRLVDNSKGPGEAVAAKCFLWGAHATELGEQLEQARGERGCIGAGWNGGSARVPAGGLGSRAGTRRS